MKWLFSGSIFRSNFLLVLSVVIMLAISNLILIRLTPIPVQQPVSTLEVARAIAGEAYVSSGSRFRISPASGDDIKATAQAEDEKILARIIAQQAHLAPEKVRFSLDRNPNSTQATRPRFLATSYGDYLQQAAHVYANDPRFSPLLFGPVKVSAQKPDGRWVTLTLDRPEPAWRFGIERGILIALLAMLPVTWLFSRSLARPVQALERMTDKIGQGQLVTDEIGGPFEVRAVARALKQMQERIRSNMAQRAEMLAAIAHDLRTPLARLNFIAAAQDDPLRTRFADEIAEMDQMIASTLDYVRSETVSPAREKVDLRLLLAGIVDDFTDRELSARLIDGPAAIVRADPIMLRRVFENIIGNAVKYGHDATVDLQIAGGEAKIRMSDKGAGMKAEEMERAFNPFYRAESSRNRETGGAGLGLAIAKAGIDMHGGTITLDSPIDGGLMVSVTLPLHDK